jgi:hypothetical protein
MDWTKLDKFIDDFENGFKKLFNKKNLLKSFQKQTKHVTFVDTIGMELKTEHKITTEDEDEEIIKNNKNNNEISIIPKFNICNTLDKLIKNKVCLNSVEIKNESMSIRGTVLTLNEINNNNNESIETKLKKRINYFNNKRNKKLNLDLVYVIYTTDKWKTWKFMNTLQKSCKINDSNKLIRTHEFFIQNIINNNTNNNNDENILQLQLIVCYQIDSHVYQDDNQKLGFNFDLATKV